MLLGCAKDFILKTVVKSINKQCLTLESEEIIAKIKEQSYYGDRAQNLVDMIRKATEQLQQCDKGKKLIKSFMKKQYVGNQPAKKFTYKLLIEFLESQEVKNACLPHNLENKEFSQIIDNLNALVAAKESLPAAQQSKPYYEFSLEDETIEAKPTQPPSRLHQISARHVENFNSSSFV